MSYEILNARNHVNQSITQRLKAILRYIDLIIEIHCYENKQFSQINVSLEYLMNVCRYKNGSSILTFSFSVNLKLGIPI